MIKFITTKQTYPIRQSVLRDGKPIETCVFDGDDDAMTKHLGYFDGGDVVGILSIFSNQVSLHSKKKYDEDAWQLRGMAVAEAAQRKGVGKALVMFAVNFLQQFEPTIFWCNAREGAVNFYERLGFCTVSDEFHVEGIGPHYVMVCDLVKR